VAAMLTNSANERACIFRMIRPRCALTVISLIPSSSPTSLLNRPVTTRLMTLVVSGHLNKQVGGELGISEITVKADRGKVMRKMQAASLVHLINMTARLRLAVPVRASVKSEGSESRWIGRYHRSIVMPAHGGSNDSLFLGYGDQQ
jgi:DNA-binding CsgD family transcriptional regulator